jgi:predicted CxxxxCH...CXXCH cytochrome family protein
LRRRIPCVTLLAVFTVIAGVSLFAAGALLAGVTGSPHDFSKSNPLYNLAPVSPAGSCSICHIPHNALYGALWPRDLLSTYDNQLLMNGGTGSTDKPNYKRPVTVQCYDCHDAHVTTTKINDDPLLSGFDTSHKPQNVAFGFTKNGTGNMTEDPPAGTVPGYYENNPPYLGTPSTYYGADTSFARPLDNATLLKTGGHFFKYQNPSTTVYKGDKLGCSECHDPHAWDSANKDWHAFFRPSKLYGYPSRTGRWNTIFSANPRASSYMANPVASGVQPRSDVDSRKMCILCHGDSNSTVPVTFNDINSDYSSSSQIVRPPGTIGEHASGSQIACVSCHDHNAIGANCSQCHGFPPSSTANPVYPSTATSRFVPAPPPTSEDSHAKHYGGRSGETRNSLPGYIYRIDCGNCHYGSALGIDPTMQQHQNSLVSVVLAAGWTATPNQTGAFPYDNTNYYNPGNGGAGQLDNGTNDIPGYSSWGAGARYGGNNCRNVYCHSIGRKVSSMTPGDNNSYRLDVAWNSGPQHCNDCHGRSVADNTNPAWGMPDYVGGAVGSDTANSHGAHVVRAGYECSVCHFTTVTGTGAGRAILASPRPSNHVDNVRQVAFNPGVVMGSPTYGDVPATKTCVVSCHGSNPVRWGGPPQNCDTCHVRVGDVDDFGTGTQASMSNNSITAGIDNNEWNWSGHGKDSGQYDVSLNPAANLRSGGGTGTNKCAFCHNPAIAHDNASNPFRLANYNVFSQGWNGACYVCHASASVGNSASGFAPTADNTGSYAAKTASQKVASNHFNPGTASNARHSAVYNGGAFCFDCHDPHGDRTSAGVGNIFMVGKRVSMRTDNAAGTGIPVGGNDNTNRPTAAFTNNVNGIDYAHTTDNAAGPPFDRICETCHDSASGILHYTRTGRLDMTHFTTKCITCHTHDGGFRGLGGPDVGQYFDRSIQAPGPSNYADNSSHPLLGLTTGDTTLRFTGTGTVNCLGCHYSSGPARTSDECLMCHFENVGSGGTPGALDGTRHMDRQIELATISGNSLPTSQFTIGTIQQYDSWCLQCHGSESGITLGGISPLVSRRTVIDAAGFAAGRHRAVVPPDGPVGCIYCHAPHGRGNARIVRENPVNRRTAGPTPMRFGVFPSDNLNLGVYGTAQNVPYRARVDYTLPNVFADADDDHVFCNAACHDVTASRRKDKVIRRDDNITGNYTTTGAPSFKKIYIVNGVQYTNDNTQTWMHGHVNDEIITTDNMVIYYKNLIGLTGPSYYRYPRFPSGPSDANPATFNNLSSPIPFFPDFVDGSRDFTNGYLGLGPIRYRFTCSTCHNPHGTTLANTSGSNGYPDLRLRRMNPADLCNECHK